MNPWLVFGVVSVAVIVALILFFGFMFLVIMFGSDHDA